MIHSSARKVSSWVLHIHICSVTGIMKNEFLSDAEYKILIIVLDLYMYLWRNSVLHN
jgi:hypothetical protein